MSIKTERLSIPDCLLIEVNSFADGRGRFSETYNRPAFEAAGISEEFVQDNQSLSVLAGTIRGLHFQALPFAQAKLVRVLRGSLLDVAVDIRKGSPTFGQHVAVKLDAASSRMIYIPEGFAHGFCTLEADTEVFYKVSASYAPQHEYGVRWSDPALGIAWPVDSADAVLSDKDQLYPDLEQLPSFFEVSDAVDV